MKKEAIGIGETIEEAKENALLELGASAEDDVQFDVISLPRKKALGIFGGAKAEVKAFIEVPQKNQPKKAAPKKEKVAKQPKQTEKKNTVTTETVAENAVPANQIDAATPAGKALKYLNNILNNLGCNNTEINVVLKDNGAEFYISGEGLGVVIGRRGETLDSLQYLTSLSANAGNGYYRVTLNIGDYRQKREQALMGLAKRMSAQVLRNGRSRTLEPMNPYERRIIHTTVQEIEGVYSKSIGEGSGRRVVISAEKGAQKPARANNANAPANTEREPKRDAEIPLYGKIN